MEKPIDIVKNKLIFITKAIPIDATKNMGMYAIDIKYTNGTNQVFTTKSTNPNHFGSHDFESIEEFLEVVHFCRDNNIPNE